MDRSARPALFVAAQRSVGRAVGVGAALLATMADADGLIPAAVLVEHALEARGERGVAERLTALGAVGIGTAAGLTLEADLLPNGHQDEAEW